ncbi:hypothetical protein [Cellulomonas massiliensis]|uniref:hypothetical protein n=1 Tax=Cellulomonas massiliensis TaxID=1465811 RepID=UPI0002F104F1|nr:hypothetical protein [Cellulomonas massiliensis]
MSDETTVEGATDPAARFRSLPDPVRLEDTVALVAASDERDPRGGRDTETEFMLRHLA